MDGDAEDPGGKEAWEGDMLGDVSELKDSDLEFTGNVKLLKLMSDMLFST